MSKGSTLEHLRAGVEILSDTLEEVLKLIKREEVEKKFG